MDYFCDILKKLRSDRKILQKDIAEYLGITVRAYQHYEAGTRFPDFPGFIALADFFNVGLDYLVGRGSTLLPEPISYSESKSVFAKNLTSARINDKHKYRQKDIAAFLDIPTRKYQSYEDGDDEPSINQLIAIADLFKCSVDSLVGRSDHTKINTNPPAPDAPVNDAEPAETQP